MRIGKELYNQVAAICEVANIAMIGENIFLYHSFTPSSSGNTSSIDFCAIMGINVTDFFADNRFDVTTTPVHYQARFTKYIENLPLLQIKFNKTTEYFLFSK